MAAFQFMFILPTTHCTARCEFCFYETGYTRRVAAVNFLDPLEKALDVMMLNGMQQIIISGGEPLVAGNLFPLIELCSRKIMHLLLLTRGDPLDDDAIDLLETVGIDDITLSVTHVDEQSRARVHRIMFRSRFFPTLMTSLTRHNIDDIPKLLEFSTRLNLPHLFTPAYIPPTAQRSQDLSLRGLSANQWLGVMERLLPWAEDMGTSTYLQFVYDFYAGKPVFPRTCPMGTLGFVIDADGSVYPCFHRHDLCAGNLLTQDWPAIQERLESFGAKLKAAPCFGEHCLSMFT